MFLFFLFLFHTFVFPFLPRTTRTDQPRPVPFSVVGENGKLEGLFRPYTAFERTTPSSRGGAPYPVIPSLLGGPAHAKV